MFHVKYIEGFARPVEQISFKAHGAQFADKFIDICLDYNSIIHFPDVVDGFIENNNEVIDSFKKYFDFRVNIKKKMSCYNHPSVIFNPNKVDCSKTKITYELNEDQHQELRVKLWEAEYKAIKLIFINILNQPFLICLWAF